MGSGTGSSAIGFKATGELATPLYNPSQLKKQLTQLSKSIAGFDGIVNSLNYLPRGRASSHGWFLTTRGDIEDNLPDLVLGKIQEVSIQFVEKGETLPVAPHSNVKGSTSYAGHDFTIEKMLAIKAYAVTGIPEPNITSTTTSVDGMLESEATSWRNQFYVVHVVDWRYFGHLSCVTKSYNDRVRLWEEGVTDDLYNRPARTGLSWSTLLNDLWGMLPDDMGSLTLSSSVNFPSASSTSLNLKFWGMTAWDAFWSLLNQTFHTLIRKYDGTWEVVRLGLAETTTSDERASNEEDITSISNDLTAKQLPETVRIIFPKWDFQWQTSSDADEPTSKDYWHNRPVWYIDKTTTSILGSSYGDGFIIEGSVHCIHSGVFAQFDPRDGGSPPAQDVFEDTTSITPANNTSLQTLATLLAENYLNGEISRSDPILQEHYRGFINFTPSKDLSSIFWGEAGTGPITRIMNLPLDQGGKFDRDASGTGSSRKGGGGAPSAKYDSSASSSQRVANEFPGSPDHARMDEPVLRWCIAQLSAECDPLAQVSATVKYGIPTSSDHDGALAGDQRIKWDGTNSITASSKTILVNNVSTGVTVSSGTRVFAAWNEQIRRWVFVPWAEGGADVEKGGEVCAATNGSQPIVGGVHDGERWIWGNGWSYIASYTHDDCIQDLKLLRVNQDTFLRSYRRSSAYGVGDDCDGVAWPHAIEKEMLISIDPAIDLGGSVFWSNGSNIRWTKAPHIGKEILLGDGLTPGNDPPRIRFQHAESVASTFTDHFEIICRAINTNLVTGTAPYIDEVASMNSKVLLPNNADTFSPGQHLSVKSTGGSSNPNCLKLRWTAPGVTASFDVDTSGGTRTLYFDDGILIGVTQENSSALESGWYRTDHEDANCTLVTYVAPDPCIASHSH